MRRRVYRLLMRWWFVRVSIRGMDIKNRTFVVTGAARGLGLGIATSLADHGARLALIDQDKDAVQAAHVSLAKHSDGHSWHSANVADETSVIDVFKHINDTHGSISGLVNNAGILRDGLLLKVDKDAENKPHVSNTLALAHWQAVIDVNLTGVFLCGREAAKHMVNADNGGVIINLSSVSRAGNFGQSNYSAAKAGVAALTVTWAKELARYGVRVAALAPGVFNTDMVASMKPEAAERLLQTTPLRRLGDVSEIAHTVRYIIENDYFTGRVIEIDGGVRL